jgi:hypothetical protein
VGELVYRGGAGDAGGLMFASCDGF